ncbi:Clp protease ClpP [Candidatus Dojkabacteria bacterium]|uniref:ATP-dependent Clp protease proteolytic subunit n=1 Tax=Candidatus Dojkabacteria bacterium TaxID=2099670 RepID=A0A5C7JAF0_9BACT|nr:MAG: Clp protease ClpP [Candidatus Dojkabacteria bacterium]
MPKLLDFKGVKAGSPLKILNKSETEAEIVVYAGIGQDFWGDGSMISAKNFSDELKKLPDSVKNINVRINSPGGDVFDGIAIYNRLKQHKAKKTVYVDGLAASIASIIALAGDEIIMGEGALFMVHLPWTWAAGNRNDLDNIINRLTDVEEQMISIYTKKTKMSRTEVRAMLEAETWMDSEEAIDKGFVDKKSEETFAIAASVKKSPWINKMPEKFVSEADVIQEKVNALKKNLSACLARK